MNRSRVRLGRKGEELAAVELAERGYEIVARNWHCQYGELDIAVRRGSVWTFFEVRTRRGRAFGTPEESVTPSKMERMVEVAMMFLAEHGLNVHATDWRLGFVAVEMDKAGCVLRVDVYENL